MLENIQPDFYEKERLLQIKRQKCHYNVNIQPNSINTLSGNQPNFDKVKKMVVILLMLIYGAATMGATVHMHYCMNKLVGWSLHHDKEDTCGRCGMEEKDKDGCCKDEQKHVKLKVDHQKSSISQQVIFIASLALVTPVVSFDINAAVTTLSETYPTSHAPPGIDRKPLYLLHGVFLI